MMVVLELCPIAAAEELPSSHVILSFDVSGSLSDKYVGKEMHGVLDSFLTSLLFEKIPDIAPYHDKGPDRVNATIEPEAPDKNLFPLITENTVVSVFTFGKEIHKKEVRKAGVTAGDLEKLVPKVYPEQSTDTAAATKAATELSELAEDDMVRWVWVSDGMDDPLDLNNKAKLPKIFAKYDFPLLLGLSLEVPRSIYEPLRDKWLKEDAGLVAAFGKPDPNHPHGGPPDHVAIYVFGIYDKEGLKAPQNLSYDLDAKNKNEVVLKWCPGEWRPDAPSPTIPNQKAQHYEVQSSTDRKSWSPLPQPVAATEKSAYTFPVPEVPGSLIYFRVAAVANGKKRLSPELPVRLLRAEATATSGRIMWDSPKDPEITMQIQKNLGDKGWQEIGRVPSTAGKFETNQIEPGDWLRLTALNAKGEPVALEEQQVPKAETPTPTPRGPQSPPPPVITPPVSASPTSDTSVGGGGSAALLFLILMAVLVAVGGIVLWKLLKVSVSFALTCPTLKDDKGSPVKKPFNLRSKERIEFHEPGAGEDDEKIAAWWPEVDAPSDFIVHRGRRAVYHVRLSEPDVATGETVADIDELLISGNEFKVKTTSGAEKSLIYEETEAAAAPAFDDGGIGEVTHETDETDADGDVI